MEDRIKAAVIAPFVADCMALGPHWIYDTEIIKTRFGKIDSPAAPGKDSFHQTRKKGDFTHYGDQMLVLLRSLADKKAFDLQDYSEKWRAMFKDYDGYIDGATRKTIANYEKGKQAKNAGSPSNDFAGAARIAPLTCLYGDDQEKFAEAARLQTAMTHNDEAVIDASDFFARVVCSVLQGASPVEAIENISRLEDFAMSPVSMYVGPGLKSLGEETISAIKRFGQACEINQAFASTIHLIARYENNLKEAIVQSVMAGGDSAARASMAALVIGAHLGMEAIPESWINQVNRLKEIQPLMKQIL